MRRVEVHHQNGRDRRSGSKPEAPRRRLARQDGGYSFGRLMILFASFFLLVTMVFGELMASLDRDGVTVDATVTKMRWWKGQEPDVWVRYTVPGDTESRTSHYEVSPEFYEGLHVGQTLPLRVVPGRITGHIEQGGGGHLWFLPFYGFFALCFAVGVGLRQSALGRARRMRRILTAGVPVEARVDRVLEDDGEHFLAYRYRGDDGLVRRGKSGPHARRALMGLEPDMPIEVRADPDDLSESVWIDAPQRGPARTEHRVTIETA